MYDLLIYKDLYKYHQRLQGQVNPPTLSQSNKPVICYINLNRCRFNSQISNFKRFFISLCIDRNRGFGFLKKVLQQVIGLNLQILSSSIPSFSASQRGRAWLLASQRWRAGLVLRSRHKMIQRSCSKVRTRWYKRADWVERYRERFWL